MQYSREFIAEHELLRAREPLLQHLVDTYGSESNTRFSPRCPGAADLRPHRGRHLVRGGSQGDSGRGTARPAIMQVTGVHLSTALERG